MSNHYRQPQGYHRGEITEAITLATALGKGELMVGYNEVVKRTRLYTGGSRLRRFESCPYHLLLCVNCKRKTRSTGRGDTEIILTNNNFMLRVLDNLFWDVIIYSGIAAGGWLFGYLICITWNIGSFAR